MFDLWSIKTLSSFSNILLPMWSPSAILYYIFDFSYSNRILYLCLLTVVWLIYGHWYCSIGCLLSCLSLCHLQIFAVISYIPSSKSIVIHHTIQGFKWSPGYITSCLLLGWCKTTVDMIVQPTLHPTSGCILQRDLASMCNSDGWWEL